MAANHQGSSYSSARSVRDQHGLPVPAVSSPGAPARVPSNESSRPARHAFELRAKEPGSNSVAVNAAFMWEVKSVNEDLWHVVELVQTLCKRPHLLARRTKKLVSLLEQLVDLVGMQFTLEEAYGYFDDPEHVEPQVSMQAVDLRNEHSVLYQSLMSIVDLAQEYFFKNDENGLQYRIPSLFHVFLDQFKAHDERECALTLSAMNQDIGVGD